MRHLVAALFAVVLLVNGAPPVSANTGVGVDLLKEMKGAKPSVVLAWGSYTFTVNLKTNGSASRLTVTPTSLTNGIAISLSVVRISFAAPTAYAVSGNTISRTGMTPETGDNVKITVSVWQPLGSPTVKLSYAYLAKDKNGVWR